MKATTSFCVPDTLTNYATGGFSCTIGDKTFGSFEFAISSLAGTPASASAIMVVPGGTSLDPSFNFEAAYFVSGLASSETVTIGYTGTAPANSPFISDNLSLTGASVTGLGAITAAEALCLNGSFSAVTLPLICSSGVSANLSLLANITNANLNGTVAFNFNPVTTLGVVKQITLTGALGSTAGASSLNNQLAAIPEPSSWLLCLLGAAFYGTLRWRRTTESATPTAATADSEPGPHPGLRSRSSAALLK
jgi:hypothetical protein